MTQEGFIGAKGWQGPVQSVQDGQHSACAGARLPSSGPGADKAGAAGKFGAIAGQGGVVGEHASIMRGARMRKLWLRQPGVEQQAIMRRCLRGQGALHPSAASGWAGTAAGAAGSAGGVSKSRGPRPSQWISHMRSSVRSKSQTQPAVSNSGQVRRAACRRARSEARLPWSSPSSTACRGRG